MIIHTICLVWVWFPSSSICDDSGISIDDALPFHKLLGYADALDWVLMALGTLGSVVHGMAQPIGYLLLGKALDAFGNNIDDLDAMVDALYEVYLPIVFILLFCIERYYVRIYFVFMFW